MAVANTEESLMTRPQLRVKELIEGGAENLRHLLEDELRHRLTNSRLAERVNVSKRIHYPGVGIDLDGIIFAVPTVAQNEVRSIDELIDLLIHRYVEDLDFTAKSLLVPEKLTYERHKRDGFTYLAQSMVGVSKDMYDENDIRQLLLSGSPDVGMLITNKNIRGLGLGALDAGNDFSIETYKRWLSTVKHLDFSQVIQGFTDDELVGVIKFILLGYLKTGWSDSASLLRRFNPTLVKKASQGLEADDYVPPLENLSFVNTGSVSRDYLINGGDTSRHLVRISTNVLISDFKRFRRGISEAGQLDLCVNTRPLESTAKGVQEDVPFHLTWVLANNPNVRLMNQCSKKNLADLLDYVKENWDRFIETAQALDFLKEGASTELDTARLDRLLVEAARPDSVDTSVQVIEN